MLTDGVIKYVKKPENDKKIKKLAGSWISAKQQSLGVPAGGKILLLFHYAKVGLEGMCYENRSTFVSLVPGGKERNLFSFLTFWK